MEFFVVVEETTKLLLLLNKLKEEAIISPCGFIVFIATNSLNKRLFA
jgi:hypothetical protein